MKRNQFSARLGAVNARAERIMETGGLISLLTLGSIGTYIFGVRRTTRFDGLVKLEAAGFAITIVNMFACFALFRRTIADRSPTCPHGAGRIPFPQSKVALESGRCPHCNSELFRDSS